jgi:hypothetical protein
MTYEETIAALQGFVGQPVSVSVKAWGGGVSFEFAGNLRGAVELPELQRKALELTDGDALLWCLENGESETVEGASNFVLSEETFIEADWYGEALTLVIDPGIVFRVNPSCVVANRYPVLT